jgi:hypothetical protein
VAPPSVDSKAASFAGDGLERDDHGAVRLHQRLTAEAVIVPQRADRGAPRQTAVRGRAHLLEVVLTKVVELRVAMAIERA